MRKNTKRCNKWCLLAIICTLVLSNESMGSVIIRGVILEDYWPVLGEDFVDVGDRFKITVPDYDLLSEIGALDFEYPFEARLEMGSLDDVSPWYRPLGGTGITSGILGGPNGKTFTRLHPGAYFHFDIDIGSIFGEVKRIDESGATPELSSVLIWTVLAFTLFPFRCRAR